MALWTDLRDALNALRVFLSDGPQDKPVKGKAVVGNIDGVNPQFVTYDDRLVTGSLRVSVNDVFVSAILEDEVMGQFTLAVAPPLEARVLAYYFFQYFLDDELELALVQAASQFENSDGDVTLIAPGLQLALLHFAGFLAYEKMATKWVERMSSRFLMLEAPSEKDTLSRVNLFRDTARDFRDQAAKLRLDYYQNQGRRAKPAFGVYYPQVGRGSIGPRR